MSKKMNIVSICFSVIQAAIYLFLFLFQNINQAIPLVFYGYLFLFPLCAILFAFLGITHDLNKWAWMSIVMSYVLQFLIGIIAMSGLGL